MIGQYLSNKNESATVPQRKKFCKLNKALVLKKFYKIFQIFRHIESLEVCMKY